MEISACTDALHLFPSPSSLSFTPVLFRSLHPFLLLSTSFHLNLPRISGHRGSNHLKCSGWQWELMRNLPECWLAKVSSWSTLRCIQMQEAHLCLLFSFCLFWKILPNYKSLHKTNKTHKGRANLPKIRYRCNQPARQLIFWNVFCGNWSIEFPV